MNGSRLVPWLKLCRAPNTLTAFADVVAGATLAGRHPFAIDVLFVAAGGALLSAGGVALHDVADVEKDRVVHPERVLPSGRLPVESARTVGFALMIAGTLTSAPFAGPGSLFSILTFGAILHYDFGRATPLSGCFSLGLARGFNLLRGAATAGVASYAALNASAFHAALIAVVTYISTFEDEPSDAPTASGLRTAVRLLPLALLGPLFAGSALGGVGGAVVGGAGALAIAYYVVLGGPGVAAKPTSAVPRVVFGLVLLDAAYLAAAGFLIEACLLGSLFFVSSQLRKSLAQAGA